MENWCDKIEIQAFKFRDIPKNILSKCDEKAIEDLISFMTMF